MKPVTKFSGELVTGSVQPQEAKTLAKGNAGGGTPELPRLDFSKAANSQYKLLGY